MSENGTVEREMGVYSKWRDEMSAFSLSEHRIPHIKCHEMILHQFTHALIFYFIFQKLFHIKYFHIESSKIFQRVH